ncbi:MAG: hypothetical protein M0Z91_05830 [Actinomycetota bacterium]|nr:hypothetical protein [Actinomycetota bacterium]
MSNYPNLTAMLRVVAGEVSPEIPDDYVPGEFVRAVQAEAERQAAKVKPDATNGPSMTKSIIPHRNPPQNRSQRP